MAHGQRKGGGVMKACATDLPCGSCTRGWEMGLQSGIATILPTHFETFGQRVASVSSCVIGLGKLS